eukprot:COSAG06_NODE_15266_length_1084_cov_0.677485_1_plen_67_part_10
MDGFGSHAPVSINGRFAHRLVVQWCALGRVVVCWLPHTRRSRLQPSDPGLLQLHQLRSEQFIFRCEV